MQSRVGALCALLVLGLAFRGPEARDIGRTPDREAHRLDTLIARHRATVGCTPLAWHDGLAGVARAHSQDMVRRAYFAHVSPEGEEFDRRLRRAGIYWFGPAAENLALTPAGATSVLELWLDSPPHRANLENCAFTHHGIGRHADHWTQVLARNPIP